MSNIRCLTLVQKVSAIFAGRGWTVYPDPVALEPAFRPFLRHLQPPEGSDDGRRPGIFERLGNWLASQSADIPQKPLIIYPVMPRAAPAIKLQEWDLVIPDGCAVPEGVSEAWLRATSLATHAIALEFLGTAGAVSIRLAIAPIDSELVIGQLRAHLPRAVIRLSEGSFCSIWNPETTVALELGLAREFMVLLRVPPEKPDPLVSIVAALADAGTGEAVAMQVLFEEVRAPWADHALAATLSPDGTPFFLDAPDLASDADEKFASPLYAVVIRIAAMGKDTDDAFERLRGVASALRQFSNPRGNELIPLATENPAELLEDICARRTRRSGMLLSLPELAAFVRLPGPDFEHPALVRSVDSILPAEVLGGGTPLGLAKDGRHLVPVALPPSARIQHTHVVGASGTGKSTLLERMLVDDIAKGKGVALLDPHGDLADAVLGRIPEDRIGDVILFDPGGAEPSVGWNILSARSEAERRVLSSDLIASIRRQSTSWGDQMGVVLANAIDAILATPHGGTLLDLRQFLLDGAFRERVLATINDDYTVGFWRQEFPLLVGKRPHAPILTRLDSFLRSTVIRDAVCERARPIDFRSLLDNGRIFVAKLSQGLIGEENCSLLSSLLLSAFHQAALSRQSLGVADRTPFQLYIDEFHQVATPSLATLFSGIRKYGLGLTVAHQNLYQLHAEAPEVERAVLGNAHSRIVFRVADEDARKLSQGMGSFRAGDLLELDRGEAIVRVGSGRGRQAPSHGHLGGLR